MDKRELVFAVARLAPVALYFMYPLYAETTAVAGEANTEHVFGHTANLLASATHARPLHRYAALAQFAAYGCVTAADLRFAQVCALALLVIMFLRVREATFASWDDVSTVSVCAWQFVASVLLMLLPIVQVAFNRHFKPRAQAVVPAATNMGVHQSLLAEFAL